MLISADSHVVEPGDLWTSRLPAGFRDRAPRAVQDPVNHHWYLVDATLAADPGADVGARGGSDAVERLRDLWSDETVADVLYPTAGLSILQLEDVDLQHACCSAYNDWLSELCAVDPDRLLGLAMIQTNDIERGVAELERTRAAGLRGAIIWTAPPEGDSFFDPDYEPLWAAAAALAMPISLHILAGRRANIRTYGRDVRGTFYAGFESRQEMHRSVCELIAAGVFERHPDLRVVAAEGGIEYAANLERRLDFSYRGFWHKFSELTMPPSEYFRRNVYLTYMTDPLGLNNLQFTGADHFMWSSDYPHMAAVWPESRAAIERDAEQVGGLDDETIHKLTVANVARLYDIDLDVVAQPSPVLGDVRVPAS